MNGQSHEETYIVEKIVKKRIREGKAQYLIKWQGYPSTKNTWEPRSHLAECEHLIKQFKSEKTPSKRRSKASNGTSRTSDINTSLMKSKNVAGVELNESTSNGIGDRRSNEVNSEKVTFAGNLTPQEIVGYVVCDGEHCFLIKWEGSNEIGMVENNEVRKYFPQLVIQFYESKIIFKPATK